MNARLQESMRAQTRRKEWCEDIEVRFAGRVGHFSVQADVSQDVDGNVIIDRVYYDDKAIPLPPVIVEMLEQALQDELRDELP